MKLKMLYALTHTPNAFEVGSVIPGYGKIVELRRVSDTKGADPRQSFPCYEIYYEVSMIEVIKKNLEKNGK